MTPLFLLPILSLAPPAPAPTATAALDYASLDAPLPNAAFVEPVVQDDDEGSPFSYTFVEIGFITTNLDNFGGIEEDADSYVLNASLSLGMFYLLGSYGNTEVDLGNSKSDTLSLGVGAHVNVAPKLDLRGDISWLWSDVSSDIPALEDTNNGYEARAGARWMPLDWGGGGLELQGHVRYRDIEGITSNDGQFGWDLGARLHFIQLFSIGANYILWEDDDSVLVTGRVSF